MVTQTLVRIDRLGEPDNVAQETVNLKNLSEGGILFASYQNVPVSSVIKITFLIPGRELPIEAYGKVTHTSKIGKANIIYHIGAIFLDLPAIDRRVISDLVADAEKDKIGNKLILKRPKWWIIGRRRKKANESIPGTKGAFFRMGKPK